MQSIRVTVILVSAGLLATLPQLSLAQAPTPRSASRLRQAARRPVTSPYLYLLENNGSSLSFNYFRKVRPEVEFRRSDARLNRSIRRLKQRVEVNERTQRRQSQLGTTGHRATFLSRGNYFPLRRNR